MGNYVEIQARKKAHELVLMTFRGFKFRSADIKQFERLKNSISNIPAELYEAHGRLFNDEKLKHISKARGHLYEARYYLNLFDDLGKINKMFKQEIFIKIELLDKLLLSMIRNSREIKIRR